MRESKDISEAMQRVQTVETQLAENSGHCLARSPPHLTCLKSRCDSRQVR